MKLFYSVVLYMFISGIALSGIIKVSSDRCGPVKKKVTIHDWNK